MHISSDAVGLMSHSSHSGYGDKSSYCGPAVIAKK